MPRLVRLPLVYLVPALVLLVTGWPPAAAAQDAAAQPDAGAAQAPAAAPPDVLNQLPADYASAIIVPHLGVLDAGLAAFESASVLDLGELQDVVGRFKREMGLARGVDDGGSMAVVVIEPGDEPIVVMLIPVLDADALAVSLGAAFAGGGGLSVEVTLPSGERGAMRAIDGYVVLGANPRVVEAYAPANDAEAFTDRFGTLATQALTQSQLCFAFDPTRMDADTLGAELTSYALAVLMHADTLLAYDIEPGKMLPMLSSMSQHIARGTDAAVVGFDFGTRGMGYREAYRLNGETAMADLFPGASADGDDANDTDAADTLAKLPAGPAVFAIAGDPAAVGFVEMFDRFGGLLGLDPRHALGTAKPALQDLVAQADHVATAYYVLDSANQATSRWMNTVSVFETQDPESFAASFEQAVMALNDAQLPVGGGEPITFSATYEPEDRLLGGVRFDTFTVKIEVPEDLHDDPAMLALAALGQIGFIGQVAVVEGHAVVTTFDDLETMDRALASVLSGRGLGGDADFPAAGALGVRSAVGYLDLRAVAQTLAPFYAIAGSTDAAQVDPDTRPIAFALTAGQGQAGAEVFIPTSAINTLALEDFELNLRRAGESADNNNRPPAGFDNGPGRVGPGNPRNPRRNPGRAPDPGRGRDVPPPPRGLR